MSAPPASTIENISFCDAWCPHESNEVQMDKSSRGKIMTNKTYEMCMSIEDWNKVIQPRRSP